MHMVVKSPARTAAPQPAGSPAPSHREASVTSTPSRDSPGSPTPQPAAAAAVAAPPGSAPQQSALRREADPGASSAAGSGSAHTAGGGAYQPHAASAWMQYQNAAATWGAPPWAMPQVCFRHAELSCDSSAFRCLLGTLDMQRACMVLTPVVPAFYPRACQRPARPAASRRTRHTCNSTPRWRPPTAQPWRR
jgi:hypothetical protein